jgi:serine kinase of HPr protein (carbohydrate metabolism regulator)
MLIHGSTVEIKGNAALILGAPGMGKSSLALQLMDRGALLVADDQTQLSLENGMIVTRVPASIQGMMEVRGLGICTFPFQACSPLALCVEICEEKTLERLPEPLFIEYYGIQVPLLKLAKTDPLGAIKVELKVGLKDECEYR